MIAHLALIAALGSTALVMALWLREDRRLYRACWIALGCLSIYVALTWGQRV